MHLNKLLTRAIDELKNCDIVTPEIDVRAILKFVLEKDDVYLFTHNTDLLTNAQYQHFRRLIRRRKKGEPVAYLIGHKEFYGLDFTINKNVLIPRPETEILVEKALTYCSNLKDKNSAPRSKNITFLDIGTGSGCIIISIVKNLKPNAYSLSKFYATDISTKALSVAKKNAKALGIYDNVQFLKSDLFSNPRLPKKFDLIVANLPYLTNDKKGIRYTDPEKIGLAYEPEEALYADDAGFQLIERLVMKLPSRLNTGGLCLLEVDESHEVKLNKLCNQLELIVSNISGNSRYHGFWSITK